MTEDVCRLRVKNSDDPCIICQKENEMPHNYCCLTECGEHEFCRGCTKGVYLKNNKN